jgi:hypothetical protein
MKNLNITLIIALILTTFSVNAQTQRTLSKKTATAATISKESTTVTSTTKIEKSEYMSADFEKKIKSRLISGEIPASLPKYTEGTSQEDYKKAIKTWGRKNITLVKEEYREQVLGGNKKASSRTK